MSERIDDYTRGRERGISRLRYNPSPVPVDTTIQPPLFDESGNPVQIGDSPKQTRSWMPEGFTPPKKGIEHWTDVYDR